MKILDKNHKEIVVDSTIKNLDFKTVYIIDDKTLNLLKNDYFNHLGKDIRVFKYLEIIKGK